MSNQKEFEFQYKDCYALASREKLVIGNNCLEQTFDLYDGVPHSASLQNKFIDDEWLQEGIGEALYRLPGQGELVGADRMYIKADVDDDFGIANRYGCIKLDIPYPTLALVVRILWKLYPDSPFAQQEILVKRLHANEEYVQDGWSVLDTGIDIEKTGSACASEEDYIHCLPFQDLHCRYEIVQLLDVTDHHNNLVRSNRGLLFTEGRESFDGNIAFIEKLLQPSGLMVLKEGPTPLARLGAKGADFSFVGKRLYVMNTGLSPEELSDEHFISAYGSAIGIYDGSEAARYQLLDTYHRNIHMDRPERDYFFMSNNWGDRSKDGRVNEPFLIAELEAAARLGITHYQIDDGWQSGTTINSVHANEAGGGRWSGYYTSGIDFWAPHPERLPRGFAPIASRARELGIHLCLWFSPDSDNDLENWEKDADTLIDLHRKYEMSHFKLDGIDLHSKRGERNLLRLMQKVVSETSNRVYFNLDTTAQTRLGYYGRTQYAALFLENRYSDWKNYYPHWTLRNLWMLSKYVPARKLQIEFLNVRRNTEKYGDDPLAPHICGLLYGAAAALFANPLAWMELTGLAEADADQLGQLLRLVAPHHHQILSGHILPIGEEPTGTGWTGLQSSTQGGQEGYILVFRESTELMSYSFKLWGLQHEQLRLEYIVGSVDRDSLCIDNDGTPFELVPDAQGQYRFEQSEQFSFSLYRYSVV